MNNRTKQLTREVIERYRTYLRQEERSSGTIEKYMRDVGAFALWLQGKAVTGEQTAAWKAHLQAAGYAPRTINSMLSALNGLLRLMKWESCCVKFLKIQRQLFREPARELSRKDYQKLVDEWETSGWGWLWKPSERRESGYRNCNISQQKPYVWARPVSSSREKYGSSCCLKSCAGN